MIFDGTTLRIILEPSDGDTVEAIDGIYSRWKDWVLNDDGSKYAEAFTESFGGNALGGGKQAGNYVFLNTAAGWKIRPREAAHELTIAGNIYPDIAGASMFAPTLGTYQIQINLERSSLTQIVGGGFESQVQSAMTAQGYTTARAAFLDELDVTDPDSVAAAVQLIRRISDNRLEVDIPGQALRLYDDAGVAVIRSWPLSTTGGEPVQTGAGIQTGRGVPA
jgi:hypothetical protein